MTAHSTLASLDLRTVEATQRAHAWSRQASDCFPGLSVQELDTPPAAGTMQGQALGPGSLWRIQSPAVRVSYEPPDADAGQTFSVMLQLQGSTLARQHRHACRLEPGEICLIDGLLPFELQVHDSLSHVMFLQLPRGVVLARHPYLERRAAVVLDKEDAGTVLLAGVLENLFESAPFLAEHQRATALVAIAQLLGVVKDSRESPVEEVNSRVRHALAFIDAHLSETSLDANTVARDQGVSRRWLDELFQKTVGTSLSAQIWMRRLQQAASDLRDPALAARTVTQIAFGVGFEDAAHFTRTFKRHYQCTPREYRAAMKVDSVRPMAGNLSKRSTQAAEH